MEETLGTALSAQTGVTEPAAAAPTGEAEPAPAAGVTDDTSEFEDLIKGRFKSQFDEKMQSAIRARLKGAKEIEGRYQTLVPALQLLSQRYGVEDGDAEGLCRAILGEGRLQSAAADRVYGQWLRQNEEMKNHYPDFDLQQALTDERFRTLLRSGVDIRTAYEVQHLDTLLPAAMAAAARAVEARIAKGIAADRSRPAENAMGSRAAAVMKPDVSKFTRSDVEKIARRVARGERVSFG